MTTPLQGPDPDMPRLVLLIDRDDDTREMYAEFLKSVGLELVEAADGRDGLAQALSHNPDVVVTGTRLPGIDGYELCALLRRDPTTRTTPIVVVTGDGYEADIARARAAGADSVLVKPCLPYALFDEIRTVVRRVRESQPAVLPVPATEVPPRRAPKVRTRGHRVQVKALSRTFHRHDTTQPPTAPPDLVCPACDRRLVYQRSHIGGVSERHAEQWDDYECLAGCGVFQYRQRTRTLRKVS
jgi:DNA-binding response OmpR family regulator